MPETGNHTRPAHVKAPAHLTKSPPVPEPEKMPEEPEHGGRGGLEPTRFGDWERDGIAIDF